MIVIIDYGLGNLQSMLNMIKKIGAKATISSDHDIINAADKLILPGVGSFDSGVDNLNERKLIPLLNVKILKEKTPILGVCLGMQLFGKRSEEGQMLGLGWVDAESIRFKFKNDNNDLKVPHMGWNQIKLQQVHPLFNGIDENNRFYFVHSYHVVCSRQCDVLTTTSYGFNFISSVVKDNIMGVQFHPEKSHKLGMQVLKNFVELV